MPDTAAYCPGCGEEMRSPERVQGKIGLLPRNLAGALAYLTLIPALVFLFVEPYRRDRFVRFHSLQCIGLWLALLVIAAALWVAGSVLGIIPVLPMLLLSGLIGLAAVITWLVLVVKALLGEFFKLPLLGELAEQQSTVS